MCPVDASIAVWLCAVRTLLRWKFFSRVSRVELHDQGQDFFLGHLCQSTGAGGAGVAGSLLTGDSAPGLPIRSFSCVDIGIAGSSICVNNNNNNNTIWGGSVLTGEELPPHSWELKHALTQAGGPTQSQLSRPMSSGHHISMEHRLRRKQLNSDTNASNKTYLKEIQEKRKEETFFFRKKEQGK